MRTVQPDLKEICAEKLKILATGLTAADKKRAEEELNLSRQTIADYLKGKVAKIDVAMSLIEFFAPIVSNRISKLQLI